MTRVLLDTKGICERLHVAPTWISKELWRVKVGLSKPGKLPPLIQIGGRYMCYVDELETWIEGKRVQV